MVKNLNSVKISSVNLLYLINDKINWYIEENNENKYLAQVPSDESKHILKDYEELWTKVRDLIRSKTNNLDNYD